MVSRYFAHRRIVLILGLALIGCVPATLNAFEPNRNRTETAPVNSEGKPKHTNRLIHATSPYLLQHAHNPVDWSEWGEEALRKAREEDKPIFLSIGYAACHWCHVMEHESFEKEDVAALLNENFVCIKVDREERPDIDEIYMAFTQHSTGHGGWPMSVWLFPDGRPFFAGTYFPKNQFMQLLNRISNAWESDRENLQAGADKAAAYFERWARSPQPAPDILARQTIDSAASQIAGYFDTALGGMNSSRNKFPPSMAMDLLLRVYRRTNRSQLFDAVKVTLDNMARGGIYDHLGGGICRYSTDPQWLVPHFEKMLYDQAMVSSVYLDAYQAGKDPLYAATAADILNYVLSDLTSPEGGFYSSRDADSDGMEGKFYIWTVEQIKELLGEADGQLFCEYYDVTATGNWFENRGHAPPGAKNILHITKPVATFAKMKSIDMAELRKKLSEWRAKLLSVRAKRIHPALDDKILTGWNGLMIASLAKAARVLNEPRFAEAAGRSAEFILTKMRKDGRLLRTYRKGDARLTSYLSDYAFLIEGLLNLYEATFDRKWLKAALELAETSITHYHDSQGGAFFYTADDSEKLLARSKHPYDGAIPAGNSVHALNLLRLAVIYDRKDLREKAEGILRTYTGIAGRSPGAFERLLCAADFFRDGVKEIAIIGDLKSPQTQALLQAVYDQYLPNKVVVHAPDVEPGTTYPLLKGKTKRDGKSTAYVCENYRCKSPVTEPEALAKQLADVVAR